MARADDERPVTYWYCDCGHPTPISRDQWCPICCRTENEVEMEAAQNG